MKCPICSADTKVIDSRSVEDRTKKRRRRQCLACEFRFSTQETRYDPFDRDPEYTAHLRGWIGAERGAD